MASPSAYVLTKSCDQVTSFTAMSPQAAISEFDIRPNPSTLTVVCTQSVETADFILNPGYHTLTDGATIHKVITFMLKEHNFPPEQKHLLRKTL